MKKYFLVNFFFLVEKTKHLKISKDSPKRKEAIKGGVWPIKAMNKRECREGCGKVGISILNQTRFLRGSKPIHFYRSNPQTQPQLLSTFMLNPTPASLIYKTHTLQRKSNFNNIKTHPSPSSFFLSFFFTLYRISLISIMEGDNDNNMRTFDMGALRSSLPQK